MKDILLVDDESLLVEMLNRFLAAHGYAVTTANSGAEAFAYLKLRRFDLVLCDIHMNEMDGFAVLATCKALYPQTKVILCSGDIVYETISRAFVCGADSFLIKPFQLDELLHQFDGCLTLEQQESPDIMAMADPYNTALQPGKLFCA